MAGGISLHGVDVARGVPARGMVVALWCTAPQRKLVAEGVLGANGQLDHPSAQGVGIVEGEYEALFHVGDYLRASAGDATVSASVAGGDASPFLDIVPFRFSVRDAAQHVHLPLKFTAWGYSLFRGS